VIAKPVVAKTFIVHFGTGLSNPVTPNVMVFAAILPPDICHCAHPLIVPPTPSIFCSIVALMESEIPLALIAISASLTIIVTANGKIV
jgi:hypothetical protein